jgi:hypothetical protein
MYVCMYVCIDMHTSRHGRAVIVAFVDGWMDDLGAVSASGISPPPPPVAVVLHKLCDIPVPSCMHACKVASLYSLALGYSVPAGHGKEDKSQ